MNLELESFKLPRWKRAFDIVVAGVAILIFSPFLLLIALAIRLESKGPIIQKSKRVGSNYKVFDFLKFRSVYTDIEKNLKNFKQQNQSIDKENSLDAISLEDISLDLLMISDETMLMSDEFTIVEDHYLYQKEQLQESSITKLENDSRITKLGRFMCKYGIDELPQLINIIKGDMSIVGNRPLPLCEAEMLTQDDYIDRFMGPSGLIGLWQIENRVHAGKLSDKDRKLLDTKYAKEFSFMLDLKIIIKVFYALIQNDNV